MAAMMWTRGPWPWPPWPTPKRSRPMAKNRPRPRTSRAVGERAATARPPCVTRPHRSRERQTVQQTVRRRRQRGRRRCRSSTRWCSRATSWASASRRGTRPGTFPRSWRPSKPWSRKKTCRAVTRRPLPGWPLAQWTRGSNRATSSSPSTASPWVTPWVTPCATSFTTARAAVTCSTRRLSGSALRDDPSRSDLPAPALLLGPRQCG
mmetsp:Transcript_4698/g.11043  ORF Transcript_4698/g.11043 Transcript_4698/m.11043 type:complete len:207 (-) Transcript_4698:162-782(-)